MTVSRLVTSALAAALLGLAAQGAELPEVTSLLSQGEYARVITEARRATAAEAHGEDWWLLLAEALDETGRYAEARQAAEAGIAANPQTLRLRLAARRIVRHTGDPERAAALLQEIDRLGARTWEYQSPADQVALGESALLLGADPKTVLTKFFERVKKAAPDFRPAYLASAELALAKDDFALAGKELGLARRKFPDDPEISFGLARALAPSDAEAAAEALAATLKTNPHHPGALLLMAEQHLDADRFGLAEAALGEALRTNPARPEAHALAAVLAELNGDPKRFASERQAALKPWPKNPEVEHLIGRKLSQHYRFAEGSSHQRRALEFESGFLPAKLQLAEDLLRLGEEAEGWKLAAEVQAADPYNVVAYNLVTLQEKTSHFQALESAHFLVRMDPAEGEVYGRQVLTLLESAHAHLCARYGFTPSKKTTVEIFPDPKDFAIRTFGLPGGAGYLGVCFGPVITANSPAARPGNNWQATLWHEFTHVVTLGLTRNRMPRWLSEGLSVYEERLAHGNWGEQMKPRYRAMILGEDLTPLSQLSGAFLRPKTAAHLQFAYYESSLAVEYLFERFGLGAIKAVCAELADGRSLNAALAKHCAPLAVLDREFAERAAALARATGPKLDWTAPRPGEAATPAALAQWTAAHPANYTAILQEAKALLAQGQWESAKAPLRRLIELYPEQHETDSAYALLARAHRELGETAEERTQLEKVVRLSASAAEAQSRLIELAAAGKEWPAVLAGAAALSAINPLLPELYRVQAEASAALHQPREAIAAYETLLRLEENTPPETRYRLAQQYRATDQTALAKRRLLEALEDAPRHRPALQMLEELQGK